MLYISCDFEFDNVFSDEQLDIIQEYFDKENLDFGDPCLISVENFPYVPSNDEDGSLESVTSRLKEITDRLKKTEPALTAARINPQGIDHEYLYDAKKDKWDCYYESYIYDFANETLKDEVERRGFMMASEHVYDVIAVNNEISLSVCCALTEKEARDLTKKWIEMHKDMDISCLEFIMERKSVGTVGIGEKYYTNNEFDPFLDHPVFPKARKETVWKSDPETGMECGMTSNGNIYFINGNYRYKTEYSITNWHKTSFDFDRKKGSELLDNAVINEDPIPENEMTAFSKNMEARKDINR